MKLALNLALAAGLCSCAGLPFKAPAPKDFAVLDPKSAAGDRHEFRALSPEGLVYRVSATPNQPRAGLAFWSEALQKELSGKGYVLIKTDRQKISQFEREIQQWAIPTSGPAQMYWIWMRAGQKHIVYAESGGSSLIFPSLVANLQNAADSIQLREKDFQP